mmetsp:Transcript_72656/g.115304  ORF Transcript_72656/g.115304 Transcript_72656/m.115304 type:complete len:202 (-) Transcript_72656:720-1325(-)
MLWLSFALRASSLALVVLPGHHWSHAGQRHEELRTLALDALQVRNVRPRVFLDLLFILRLVTQVAELFHHFVQVFSLVAELLQGSLPAHPLREGHDILRDRGVFLHLQLGQLPLQVRDHPKRLGGRRQCGLLWGAVEAEVTKADAEDALDECLQPKECNFVILFIVRLGLLRDFVHEGVLQLVLLVLFPFVKHIHSHLDKI